MGSQGETLVGIDGRSGADQKALAEALAQVVEGEIIHMDDFYLPPEELTAERQLTVGGCVYYSWIRLTLNSIWHNNRCTSPTFNRITMEKGTKTFRESKVYILEGAYSCYPEYKRFFDRGWGHNGIAVFADVTADEQERRIREQGGEALWKQFRELWIPMEERYFAETELRRKVDMILDDSVWPSEKLEMFMAECVPNI